ncbi:hypothetical protein ACIRG5_11165 [Lentzea sp. NPDC102401]|uniref:hypothetical protein n=1 Tax=Lentzea sp. NPDC102401 TaxID=3364128 RepID=UPI00382DA566
MLPEDLMLLELVNSGWVAFDADGVKPAVVDPAPLQNELLQESLIRLYEPINARARDIADGDWAAEAVALTLDTASRATSWGIVASSMTAASFGGSR